MYRYELPRPNVTVAAYGPEDARKRGIENWSLKPLQNQEGVRRNRSLAMELSLQLSGMRASKGYAPHVAPASACIIDAGKLHKIRLGAVDFFRNPDLPADGIFLEPGEAFVMSAAGCPIIVAADRHGQHLVVAHAGRDSLIERNAVLGERTREYLSVVHAIVAAFKRRDVPAQDLEMHMLFSIPTTVFKHDFDHPQYGRYNRQLGEFVNERWRECVEHKNGSLYLNLERLFVAQAAEMHVVSLQAIHRLDHYTDLAHTHDGGDPARRNLFIVKRNE